MRSPIQVPALLWLALALFVVPSFQASIWPAPGSLSSPTTTPVGPQRSIFRSFRDCILGLVWGGDAEKATAEQQEEWEDQSTASDKALKKYDSEVVLRLELNNDKERRALREAVDRLFLDIWQFTSDWADVRLSNDMVKPLLGLLPKTVQVKPLIPDLAQAVLESQLTASEAPASLPLGRFGLSPSPKANPVFEKYQPLSVIVPWMRLLQSMFTTHVRMVEIGTSFEGRSIPALRIGSHPHNAERYEAPRKTIIIIGGLHAREWIGTAAVSYAAYELITAYGRSRHVTKLIEEFDFVFVPTMNPDGYVYSWETDRLWRKTRQKTHLSFCPGLDLDHSFGYEWNGESTKDNPCSENYAGDTPFAAHEASEFAKWMRNETENNNANIVGFLDLHSYSQQILYPYSYTCDRAPGRYEDLQELAIGLQKAMHTTNGKMYTVSSACESATIMPMSGAGGGSALDWVFNQSVKYAYQVKLPDTGSYGFLLPARFIVPTGREVYNALVYMSEFMISSSLVDQHDESPSAKELTLVSSPTVSDHEVMIAEEEIDHFISDEIGGAIKLPSFELRKRR